MIFVAVLIRKLCLIEKTCKIVLLTIYYMGILNLTKRIKSFRANYNLIIIIALVVSILVSFLYYREKSVGEDETMTKCYLVFEYGHAGLLDSKGSILIPCKYKSVLWPKEGLSVVVNDDEKFGYCDLSGNEILPCVYDRAYGFVDGWARVRIGEKYYYIDRSGQKIFGDGFTFAYDFFDGVALVYNDGAYYYITKTGMPLDGKKYRYAQDFNEGIAWVYENGRGYACINDRGFRISGYYQDVRDFYEGYSAVKENGHWGLINKKGQLVLDCAYDNIYQYSSKDGAALTLDGKHGFFYYDGRETRQCIYDSYIIGDELYGYVNGNLVICETGETFMDIKTLTEEHVGVSKDGLLYAIANSHGELLTEMKYEYIGLWKDNMFLGYNDSVFYVLDSNGEAIDSFSYSLGTVEDVFLSSDGLICVCMDDKYGYIDQDSKIYIPFEYDYLDDLHEGIVIAERGMYSGILNTYGETIVPFEYDYIEKANIPGLYVLEKDDKKGLVDRKGRILLPCEYDEITDFQEGLSVVKQKSKYWLVNDKGKQKSHVYDLIKISCAPGYVPEQGNYPLLEVPSK